MTVIRFGENKQLLVHAPIQLTQQLRVRATCCFHNECVVHSATFNYMQAQLETLGTVSAIVVPNAQHWPFIKGYTDVWAEAKVYVTPEDSLPAKIPGLEDCNYELLRTCSGQIHQDIDQQIIEGMPSRMSECAFFHRRSLTLIVTESFNGGYSELEAPAWFGRIWFKATKEQGWSQPGLPSYILDRMQQHGNVQELRTCASKIVNTWPFRQIVHARGTNFWPSHPMKAFTDTFEVLLSRTPPAAVSTRSSTEKASQKRRASSSTASSSRPMPLKIDIHSHILPREWPMLEGINLRLRHEDDGTVMEWKDGTFFRKVQKNCFDANAILADCDTYGVDVQVMCTVPVMFNYHLKPNVAKEWSRYLNDDIAATANKNPQRLIALGTLPMQDTAMAVAEMRRCAKDLGIKGFQIGSHINAWQEGGKVKNIMLSDPVLLPIFETAAELDIGIFVHPWDMDWCDSKYWLPWLVGMPAETSLAVCSVMLGGIIDKVRP
jgi:predicted TIM-barrel fold metal-dependent hydrolase